MTLTRRLFCTVLGWALTTLPISALPFESEGKPFETDRIVVNSGPETGPDVILLPGLATPGAVWNGLANDLRDRATVHVVDIKGFGRGDGSVNATGGLMDGVLADLAAFADARGLTAPALIGHSLGGTLALQAGIERPDLFGRLMVIDALPFVALLFDPGATVEGVAPQAARIRDQIAAAEPGAGAAQTAETYAVGDAARNRIATWISDADPATVAQAFYEDMLTDLRPDLDDIGPPVTLIVPIPPGAEDEQYPDRYRRLFADVPDLKVVPIAGARHFVMLDQPDRMTEAAETFLDLKD